MTSITSSTTEEEMSKPLARWVFLRVLLLWAIFTSTPKYSLAFSLYDTVVNNEVLQGRNKKCKGSPMPKTTTRREWVTQKAGAFLVGAISTGIFFPNANASANDLLYNKKEVLQGTIFRRERAEEARRLTETFLKAKKVAGDLEAAAEFGQIDRVRPGLRAGPFQDVRRNGTEILSLVRAEAEASSTFTKKGAAGGGARKSVDVASVNEAYGRVLAAIEDADRAAKLGGTSEEVASALRAMQRPLGQFVDLVSEIFSSTFSSSPS